MDVDVAPRGHRPTPTPRDLECRAIAATLKAFNPGARDHRQPLRSGRSAVRDRGSLWRFARFNQAGARTVTGSNAGCRFARSLAEMPDGTSPAGDTRSGFDVAPAITL